MWLCVKKDNGITYAVKMINKTYILKGHTVKRILREREITEKVNNSFVIKLRFSFQDEELLYLVFDYYFNGDLFCLIEKLKYYKMTEEQAKFYAAEIVLALEYLHSNNIVYRDLKLENVLITYDGHIVLSDLGMSRYMNETDPLTKSYVGTPEYMAPEIITRQGHNKDVDWWSLGVLLYQLVVGLFPFDGESPEEIMSKIVHNTAILPSYLSPQLQSLLSLLLEKNSTLRLGHKHDALEVKKHPFFSDIDFLSLSLHLVQCSRSLSIRWRVS